MLRLHVQDIPLRKIYSCSRPPQGVGSAAEAKPFKFKIEPGSETRSNCTPAGSELGSELGSLLGRWEGYMHGERTGERTRERARERARERTRERAWERAQERAREPPRGGLTSWSAVVCHCDALDPTVTHSLATESVVYLVEESRYW